MSELLVDDKLKEEVSNVTTGRRASVIHKMPVEASCDVPSAPSEPRPAGAELYNHEQEFFLKNKLKLEEELSEYEKQKLREARELELQDPGPPPEDPPALDEPQTETRQGMELDAQIDGDTEPPPPPEEEQQDAIPEELEEAPSAPTQTALGDFQEAPPPPAEEILQGLGELEEEGEVEALPRHALSVLLEKQPPTRSLSGLPIDMVALEMEKRMFSTESVSRAQSWIPRANDVVVSAPNNAGLSILTRMIRLLGAEDEDEHEAILSKSSEKHTAVWIESSMVDADPSCLTRKQPGSFRVFKTLMTHQMLSSKISAAPKARFVVVFRHPLDLRMAYYDLLKSFYVHHQTRKFPGTSEDKWEKEFPSLDERFLDIPITLVQLTQVHQEGGNFDKYERNLHDWFTYESATPNCLFVFYEQLVTQPAVVLSKLAKFLDRQDYDEAMILRELTQRKRRLSHFAVEPSAFDDTTCISFSNKAKSRVDNVWLDIFEYDSSVEHGVSHCSTYEEQYQKLVNEPFPMVLVDKSTKKPAKPTTKQLQRITASNQDEDQILSKKSSNRTTLVGRLMKKPI